MLGFDRRAAYTGLAVIALMLPSFARAQQVETPPSDAGAATGEADASATAPAAPSEQEELRAELEALQGRIAALEADNARQRAELAALRGAQPGGDASDDAELASLLGDHGVDAEIEALTRPEPIQLYGFMDLGWQKNWGSAFDSGLAPTTANSFVLGNVNLYLDAKPALAWRALIEVRVTNLPDGADRLDVSTGTTERAQSEVQDTSATHGGLTGIRLNGIILERAHVDYQRSDLLGIRAGLFLTPYGIWNVDHGAPVRIFPRPPAFVSSQLLPDRQLGIELFGLLSLAPWELEYHLYVSNGRQLGAVDFDEDKALGGRLMLGTRDPLPLRLGASFFTGSSEDVRTVPGVTSAGELGLVPVEQIAYDELAGAGDLSIDIDRLRIRSEFVVSRILYEEGKRETFGGIPVADSTRTAGYLVVAYELPFWGFEPYVVGEFIREPIPLIADGFGVLGGGLNIYFTVTTQLRLFAVHSWAYVVDGPSPDFDINSVGARLVVAF